MSKNTAEELKQETESVTVPAFGYELIREILLPEILGPESPEILYWAGKQLARKFPLEDFTAVEDFFEKAGWGHLNVLQEKNQELELELSSQLITDRLQSKGVHHFQLEAGFIAQQIENQKELIAESFEHPRKRGGKVRFTVKWDKKDPAN
nr:YslB family protein [uncultured Bacillus sp.]